jgi:hypothetical protein
VDALSPPAFDSPSTINADDYFFDECNLDDCNDGYVVSSVPTSALQQPIVDPILKSKSVSWVISPSTKNVMTSKSLHPEMKARKLKPVEQHPSGSGCSHKCREV